MNNEEIQALMSQLKNAGLSEEDIADGILWPLFRDGKMSKEDLATLCSSIGLELDPEFDKEAGAEAGNPGENITKEEAEAAKEIKPGESQTEFEDKIEAAKETPIPEDKSDDDKSEDEEWEEARKLFKL